MAVTPRDDGRASGWPEGMPRTGTSQGAGQARAWAPPVPVRLCGPEPGQGVLYLPYRLLPPDVDTSRELIADIERQLGCAVQVTYRADDCARLPPDPRSRARRALDRLVAPLARVLGF